MYELLVRASGAPPIEGEKGAAAHLGLGAPHRGFMAAVQSCSGRGANRGRQRC